MRKQKMIGLSLAVLTIIALVLAACGTPTAVPATPTAEAADVATSVPDEVPVASPVPQEEAAVAPPATDVTQVSGQDGATDVDQQALAEALAPVATDSTLTEAEIAGLLYMREEEKLARDVYLALYDQWQVQVFQNIANSEQTHTDSVKTLLDRYGLEDPAEGKDLGEFTNQDLQDLYNSLVETGSQSLVDALRVGAAIEEIDILDLEENLAQTDAEDITLVYENLMKGSRNHLRAFVSTLEREGETYTPQYLSQEAYDAIIGSPVERGGGQGGMPSGGMGRGRGGQGHGQGGW